MSDNVKKEKEEVNNDNSAGVHLEIPDMDTFIKVCSKFYLT